MSSSTDKVFEPFVIHPRMKNASILSNRSAIKDPVVALSVASALSLPADKTTFRAEPDVVSIALAAQSAILVSFDPLDRINYF